MAWRRASVARAARAGIAAHGLAEVGEAVHLEVAAEVHAGQVRLGGVGPGDAVDHGLDVAVGQQGDLLLHAHRPGKTDRGPGHALDGGRVGQLDARGGGGAADLALVGVVVAAQQHGDRFAVGQVDEGLDHVLRPAAEKLAHLLDGAGPGGGHLGERLPRHLRGHRVAAADLRPLLVGRVAAMGAMEHDVFTVFRRHHEFMAGVAADGAAFRLDRQVTQPGAIEDAAIGRVHLLVAPVQGLQRHVEAVGVLHEEFAGAEHAEPRPLLVAKLRLHLVERQGHLPIARQAAGNQLGDDLLVRRA